MAQSAQETIEWKSEKGGSKRWRPFESPISGGDVMYCSRCGIEIADSSCFCSSCGAQQRSRATHKQLTLSATDKKMGGVCGGLAEYLDVDPTVVRLVWVALSVVPGGFVGGALAYFLAWIIIPKGLSFAASSAGAATVNPSPKPS
jgi:phage shock protein PspC (stress-responsive transcriptional regulator)